MMNVRSIGQITQNILNRQPKPEKERKTTAKPTAKDKSTPEFIHPIITKDNYRESIARYNRYVKEYNMKVWIANAKVRDYNAKVIRFRKGTPISTTQKTKEYLWKVEHKDFIPVEFNAAVEAFNTENKGLWLRKKNLRQEVKPGSEKVFLAILHRFNVQLFQRKKLHLDLGVHVPGSLPKVKIYPNKIVEQERDGYTNLPISKNTFRAHRERLAEAGVLTDYEFSGSTRPVKMRINPDILAITDNGIPKNTVTDNQSLTPLKNKKLVHSNVSSRNMLDKNKIRETKRNFSSVEIDSNCTEYSTRTPNSESSKKNNTLPEKTLKLLEKIESPEDLARDLSAGSFENYRKIEAGAIEKEAMYGAMSQDDFKELAIQDIFCTAAVLFSKMPVHPGSWVNAIKIWKAEKFITPNGYTLSKPNILAQWKKALKVLKAVKKYQKTHTEWEIRYPSIYFDPQRKSNYESSFEYALRNFRISDKQLSKTKTQRKLNHLRNSRKNTDLKKAQNKIQAFLNGKIALQTVYDYVLDNCNDTIYKNINQIIKNEFNKRKN